MRLDGPGYCNHIFRTKTELVAVERSPAYVTLRNWTSAGCMRRKMEKKRDKQFEKIVLGIEQSRP